MHVRHLHDWNLSPSDAVALQRELRASNDLSSTVSVDQLRLIGGVDVSSTKFDPILTAGIIVWDRMTGEVVDRASYRGESIFPYIPGLLSFREIPVLVHALERLNTVPDAILVDGQGIAHPRRLGIAAHLGLLIDIPTVGIAKSVLTGTYRALSDEAGAVEPMMDHDECIGMAVRTKNKVKPVFVSPGNHISMESAVALAQLCLRGYRLPEPTRLAHLYVNAVRTGQTAAHQPELF